MKTLLIDNYDSFTFNLFQYLAEINGCAPLVRENDKISWEEFATLEIDNVVISPGPGRPERTKDFGICQKIIYEAHVPILGVCLGHQGIGHVFGGKVIHAPQVMHGRISEIIHNGESLFQGVPSPFRAVRYHSLIVDNELPEVLRPTAWTRDGIIMALAHKTRPIWGIQFHPESVCTEYGYKILENFSDLSAQIHKHTATQPSMKTFRAPVQITAPQSAASGFEIRYRKLDHLVDAEAAFNAHFAGSETAVWLHSALAGNAMSRFSFMGDASGPLGAQISYYSAERKIHIARNHQHTILNGSIFDFLDSELKQFRCDDSSLPFQFVGGYIGYFGYELKQECGGVQVHSSSAPDAMFVFLDRFIAFDHEAKKTYIVELIHADSTATTNPWLDRMSVSLSRLQSLPPIPTSSISKPITFKLRHNRSTYIARIENALKEIDAGESYEVCLTNELTAELSVDGFSLYRTLNWVNPAPFSAYLKFPSLSVICASPERFLRIDRERNVQTKPIKGTCRRSPDPAEDTALAEKLSSDEKSRAENLMIVDLLRNDLGRVCEIGTVNVTKLMAVETYATVHHLVSTIEGTLKGDCSAVDCIKAAFPGGSMTGAPKVRTLEIIDHLESGARGIYSGTIGYLSVNGTADLNIVIRTIVAYSNAVSIGTGGAIVALSNPIDEFDETMLKVKALVRAIATTCGGPNGTAAVHIVGADESPVTSTAC